MKLYHYTEKENLDKILAEGLVASSKYESFTELRKNVVFCWLSPESQKIFDDNSVCLELTVDDNICIVAEMDYISFAMMYKYGGAKYGGKNIPVNLQASKLFVQLYEITALPIAKYADNFFSPEVLVKGNIDAENIKVYSKFKFINSSGIKIELAECQKMQLSSKEKIEAALTSNDVISFDIYTYSNMLIGFAMLHNCGDGWFLWNYAIDVNFQNQHYGQMALRELCELLKLKYNAKWITTTYKHGNEIARRMYERVGFVQTDIVCENGIDEINMILHL